MNMTSDDREAVDTSPEEDDVLEGAEDLPDDVRDDDVGETEPSTRALVDDDD